MLEVITMPVHSKFEEKIDVLDLIINVLKDHEENLSGTIEKFDEVHQRICALIEKMSLLDRILERLEDFKVSNIVEATGVKGPLARVRCNDWATFRAASQGALLVTFEVSDENVTISSITDLFVFTYSDGIPELMGIVSEGANRWIRKIMKNGEDKTVPPSFLPSKRDEDAYETVVNSDALRKWLSSELEMPEEKIVHGRVLC